MSGNILYELIKCFPPEEWKELKVWFRHQKKEYKDCLDALADHLVKIQNGKFSGEELFAHVFPGEPFNEFKIRRLRSDMIQLLEQYLLEQELRSDEKARQELLVRSLFRRRNYGLLAYTVQKRLAQLDGLPNRGKEHFQEKAHHYAWLYFHPETEKMSKENSVLQAYSESLQQYCTIALLETGTELLLSGRQNNHYQALALAAAKAAGIAPEPIGTTARIFHDLFRLYQRKHAPLEELEALQARLQKTMPLMDDIETGLALKFLAEFPVQLNNSGLGDFSAFSLGVVKMGEKAGAFVGRNGLVEPGHFVNFFIFACKNGEFDWAYSLLDKYHDLLPVLDRDLVKSLCMASFHFGRAVASKHPNDFVKALDLATIPPAKRKHFRYDVRLRSIAVRACFELYLLTGNYLDDLEKHLRNFENYLNRNKSMKDDLADGYLHFVRFSKALFQLYIEPATTSADVTIFLDNLAAQKKAQLRHWLREKAEGRLETLRH